MVQKLDIQKERELLKDILIGQLKRVRRRIPESIISCEQGIEILKQLRIYEYDYLNQIQHRALVLEAAEWLNKKHLLEYDWSREVISDRKILVSKLIGGRKNEIKVEAMGITSPLHFNIVIDSLTGILQDMISYSATENKLCFVSGTPRSCLHVI